ncbi:unnamed protein product [Rotaria magnacalcarata]|uniref:Uncharacterized protein n=1 Tax=Rotaria magnacalcarata TaxID=392030 RepID=A0A8S2MIT3_9BILA|nr:unnamed protein product [Rotaria magnacalcarata]
MASRQIPPSTTSTPIISSNGNQSNRDTPTVTSDKQHLSEQERMRLKEFGQLFNRHSSINRALLEELFRKEPSEYTQAVYRFASRIYHCLKEDQVNPLLKALAGTKEEPVPVKKTTLDVPKLDYASDKQKRRTLKLAFSVLRYQKIVEELLEETQFFGSYGDLKDELSLVSTILYDYLSHKSSCIAAHSIRKLLTKKDNIIIAYVSGGLLLQLLMVLTEDLESKIYAFGGRTDENIRDMLTKIKTLGATDKRVKIFKERFTDINFDEFNMEQCKVILCNPPDSRSALIQPLDFLYNEGEDVSLLKQFSQPTENKGYIKECIQRETAYMKQAVRYPLAKAIVYVTFSKNKSENEEIVHATVNEQTEQRSQTPRRDGGFYK